MNKRSPEWSRISRAIFASCKESGLDNSARRDVVKSVTGKVSMADCSEQELHKILSAIKGNKSSTTFIKARKPFVRKIWALWGELKKQNVIKAEDTNAALLTTVNRHLTSRQLENVRQFDWLTYEEASPVIEELKERVDRAKEQDSPDNG